mmetsp:Transcript_8185/g.19815  ORF Transcript_8185/g.19815 Transcript_8185/m.19815 type:complete len:173 (-) Transcript_8185:223-741(-)
MDLLMQYADRVLQPMPTLGNDFGGGGDGAAGGQEVQAQNSPSQNLSALEQAALPLAAEVTAEESEELNAASDDRYWAGFEVGPEPEPGPEVVQIAVRMPDGSRATGRRYTTFTVLGSVLSALHAAGHRLSAARTYALVNTIAQPRMTLSDLSAPLSSIEVSGKQMMLMLQDS